MTYNAGAVAMAGLPGVGLGIYHSGLEMYGREVSFGYADGGLTGVFEVPCKCAAGVMPRTTLKESVLLGYMFRSPFEGVLPPVSLLQPRTRPLLASVRPRPILQPHHLVATPSCSRSLALALWATPGSPPLPAPSSK